MDTFTLVDKQINEGGQLVKHLAKSGFRVIAGFWLKGSTDERWRMYIVSPSVEESGFDETKKSLAAHMQKLPTTAWDYPLEVELIGLDDPLAQGAMEIYERAPGPQIYPIRWGGRWIGGMTIEDDGYFYPQPDVA